ncbi:NAD(P)/FAD-dependent oxidoreductase [Xanthobacter autotrophicus]|uniref:NAD(P)/FAD-dependent oxidoreductase n=1 Tax=Xanthobacter autotrophicus TaxID=280 RepID=UPI00372C5CF8
MSQCPFVVVGASLAGLRAVEAARREGFCGPIVLVGAEDHLPYDRPPLSKAFLDSAEEPPVPHYKTREELLQLNVDLRLGRPAIGLDLGTREVLLDGGSRVPYGRLIVATGARARELPGKQLDGVHTLRTVEDAARIRRALNAGCRTVVVGGGFIGAEVASAARKRGLPVTILEAAAPPLVRALGEQMGATCAALHALYGTDLRCGVAVASIEGDGRVERVILSDGSSLVADLVVVGIGASPVTDWLEGTGLTLDDGVVCDETLRASEGVYAAGDVARWRNPLFGKSMRLEHWTAASEQGAAAARNALAPDRAAPYSTVPYFWSDWYDNKLQMVGVTGAEEVAVVGSFDERRWIALYRCGERLVGALALNLPGKIMKYRAMIGGGTAWGDALAFARGTP